MVFIVVLVLEMMNSSILAKWACLPKCQEKVAEKTRRIWISQENRFAVFEELPRRW